MNVHRKLLGVGLLLVGAACSSSGTSESAAGGASDDGGSSASSDAGAQGSDAGRAASDGGGHDAGSGIDKTPVFDITVDGSPLTADTVKVTYDPPNNLAPAEYEIEGIIDNGPNGSGATFTVVVAIDQMGAGACASNENDSPIRDVSFFYKADDSTLQGLAASQLGGSCAMTITAGNADGFSAGTASGTLGGNTTKAFTVTWGQPLTGIDGGA